MSNVQTSQNFEKEAKKLIKKYRSLVREIEELISELSQNPIKGTPLGKNCYKIRIAIKSKGRGKSGGGRVITYVVAVTDTVNLISIFDKSEKENISDEELTRLINEI